MKRTFNEIYEEFIEKKREVEYYETVVEYLQEIETSRSIEVFK